MAHASEQRDTTASRTSTPSSTSSESASRTAPLTASLKGMSFEAGAAALSPGGPVQMSRDGGPGGPGGPGSDGKLGPAVRAQMEGALGQDFSNVKVHPNSSAASALGAKAFTQGNDIHFAPGQYNPASQSGQALIGHELAHVVQQVRGRVPATGHAKGVPLNDDPGLEAEADARGAAAASAPAQAPSAQKGGDGAGGVAPAKAASPAAPVQGKGIIQAKGLGKNAVVHYPGADGEQKLGKIIKVLKKNKKKQRDVPGYRVQGQDGSVVDLPEGGVTEAQTTSQKLKDEFSKAKKASHPKDKVKFLKKFNEEYAQHLTGEVEYFQYLSQKLAYLRVQTGQEIVANVDTQNRRGVEAQMNEDIRDTKSDYASLYVVAARYTNMKAANVLLLLPKDGDLNKNAIITFRGTAGGEDGMAKDQGESRGIRADLDRKGIGKSAFDLATPTMLEFLKIAKSYNRITISGHSLGGAMAQRFYTLASKECPDKLRLLVYQSAPVDKATAEEAKTNTEGTDAKVTRVQARGDTVTRGGQAHVPGQRLSFDHKKNKGLVTTGKSHTQTLLADMQLDRKTPDSPDELRTFMDRRFNDLIGNLELKTKDTTSTKTKGALNAGRAFLGMFNGRKKQDSNYDERLEIMKTGEDSPHHAALAGLAGFAQDEKARVGKNGRHYALDAERRQDKGDRRREKPGLLDGLDMDELGGELFDRERRASAE
ncbi:MAG: DUF4157 domain-containing protein [Deltaproteobacteria bacterium]|nr:MAG: DUF4157 domain-containing protein [Deltaproteobacteria bacterium]